MLTLRAMPFPDTPSLSHGDNRMPCIFSLSVFFVICSFPFFKLKTGTFFPVHLPVLQFGFFLSSEVIDAGGLGHAPRE